MKEKIDTIHKYNSLIRAKLLKPLNLNSIKLLNYIYLEMQKSINQEKDITKINFYKPLIVKLTDIKRWLNISKNSNGYHETIKASFEELRQEIELKGYEYNGKYFKWYKTSFLGDVGLIENKGNDKMLTYKIEVKRVLFALIIKSKKDYAELDLTYQNKFRSVKTLRLYEYLKSYENMKTTDNIYMDDINIILNTKYKYLSKSLELVRRNLKIINEKTDLTVRLEHNKTDKYIKFKILDGDAIRKRKGIADKKKTYISQKQERELSYVDDALKVIEKRSLKAS